MIKHLWVFLSLFVLIGCVSPTVEDENNVDANADAIVMPTPIVAGAGEEPTTAPVVEPTLVPEATADPVPQPTAVLEPEVPIFHNLRFATAPEESPTAVFPAGTEQIFALWDFAHIPAQPQATMRRVWRFNGDAWLDREEVWDVAEYGQIGTMTSISIYDFEGGGLLSGDYDVELYLNGQLALTGSFFIQGSETAVSATDALGRTMMAVNETELTLVQTDGRSFKSVDTPHPITEIVWFASGDKVVFVTQDSSEQIGGSTLGIKHGLWLYELGTFDAVPLGFYDEDFHEVGVSANGRYLSLIAGSGYGDACGIDRAFYIMQLNDAGQRTNLYELAQFNGIPTEVGGFGLGLYPLDNGNWVDGEKVAVQLNALCVFDENGEVADDPALGIYELDVPALQAKRIGDLPAQE